MTSGQGKNGCNSSGGIMAAIQFHGREIKKSPGFSLGFLLPSNFPGLSYNTAPLKKERAVYMGRKKKIINKTNVPQYAVERFARCVFDDIRAAYADQEVQAEFARWQAQRAELNTKKKRAATTAALSVYVVFFLRGPLGLESGRMGAPLGKYSCSYLLK